VFATNESFQNGKLTTEPTVGSLRGKFEFFKKDTESNNGEQYFFALGHLYTSQFIIAILTIRITTPLPSPCFASPSWTLLITTRITPMEPSARGRAQSLSLLVPYALLLSLPLLPDPSSPTTPPLPSVPRSPCRVLPGRARRIATPTGPQGAPSRAPSSS
jgi:hypothetical protein